MFEIVYSPNWFFGKDLVIDAVGIIILFLIGLFSLKYYKIKPAKKTYLWLAVSFFMISLSFLFKIFTNFRIYYDVDVTRNIAGMMYSYELLRYTDILFYIGTLAHRIFMLLGLYALYSIYNEHTRSQTYLTAFLLAVIAVFTHSNYYIFHITSFILVALIAWKYLQNYRKSKSQPAKLLAASFGILTLSHLLFCFIMASQLLYVAAEIIQLIGFLLLLITFIKVLKDGKKKKPA
jgi:hypothetical protein